MEKSRTPMNACLRTIDYFKWRALFHGVTMLGAMLVSQLIFRLPAFSGTGLGVLLLFAAAGGVWALDALSCRRAAAVRCQHDRAIRHYFRGDPLRADTRLSAIVLAAKARFGSERGAYNQIQRTHGEITKAFKSEPFASLPARFSLGILRDPLSSLALGIRAQPGAVRQVVRLIAERGSVADDALGLLCAAYWIFDVGVFLVGCALGYMVSGMLLGLLWGYALMLLVSRVLLSPLFAIVLSSVVYPKPRVVEGAGDAQVVGEVDALGKTVTPGETRSAGEGAAPQGADAASESPVVEDWEEGSGAADGDAASNVNTSGGTDVVGGAEAVGGPVAAGSALAGGDDIALADDIAAEDVSAGGGAASAYESQTAGGL